MRDGFGGLLCLKQHGPQIPVRPRIPFIPTDCRPEHIHRFVAPAQATQRHPQRDRDVGIFGIQFRRPPQTLFGPFHAPGIAQGQPQVVEDDGIIRAVAQEQLQQLNALGLPPLLKFLNNHCHRIGPLAVRVPNHRNGLVVDPDRGVSAEAFELCREEGIDRLTKGRSPCLPGRFR